VRGSKRGVRKGAVKLEAELGLNEGVEANAEQEI
jgi:hypothetical protein